MTETIKNESEAMLKAVPEVCEEPEKKPYTFRRLNAPDVFIMAKIIKAIGINEFTACFEKEGVIDMVAAMTAEGKEMSEQDFSIAGYSVILEIADVIIGNIPKCEKEIYQILSQTSNLSIDEVKSLDMVIFLEMIIDFVRKEEFRDFIKVVSKLFK